MSCRRCCIPDREYSSRMIAFSRSATGSGVLAIEVEGDALLMQGRQLGQVGRALARDRGDGFTWPALMWGCTVPTSEKMYWTVPRSGSVSAGGTLVGATAAASAPGDSAQAVEERMGVRRSIMLFTSACD